MSDARESDSNDAMHEQQQTLQAALTRGRLRACLLAHRQVMSFASEVFDQALQLRQSDQPSVAFLHAASATELAVHHLLIRPIVSSLLQDAATCMLTARFAAGPDGRYRLARLLLRSLDSTAGFDLRSYRRRDATQDLWSEVRLLHEARGRVLRRQHVASLQEVDTAIAVAHALLKDVLPLLFVALELEVLEDGTLASTERARASRLATS